MFLNKDIYSGKRQIYGKEGDKVKIISISTPAVVVELNGNRFPCSEQDLSQTKISKYETHINSKQNVPNKGATKGKRNIGSTSAKNNIPTSGQNTLF